MRDSRSGLRLSTLAILVTLRLVAGSPGLDQASAAPARPRAEASVVSSCTQQALRAAIAAGGVVTFSCGGTITLTSQLVVTAGQDVTVNGTGSGTGSGVTISGGQTTRIFDVTGGTLALIGITLTD